MPCRNPEFLEKQLSINQKTMPPEEQCSQSMRSLVNTQKEKCSKHCNQNFASNDCQKRKHPLGSKTLSRLKRHNDHGF